MCEFRTNNKEIEIQQMWFDKGCGRKEEGKNMNKLKVMQICLEENNF